MKAKTYKLSCPDGFMVKSHKKREVADFAKKHVKKEHHKNATPAEINKMIKVLK